MIFPNFVKFRSINIDTDINVISNVEAVSGKKEVLLGDQIRTTMQLNTTPLTESEDKQFQVFLHQIKNYGLIELPLSTYGVFKPYTNDTTIPTTQLGFPVGSKIVTINGLTNDPIRVGSYIQFNNLNSTNDVTGPAKLHLVTSFEVNSNISSNRDITISPGLDTAILSGTRVNYNNLIGQFRADDGEFSSSAGTLTNRGETTKTYRFRLTEEL